MSIGRASRFTILGSALLLWGSHASAATKDECIDAHGRGQDLRDKGQLAKARQTFLSCAQSTCPALVQSDCSRFSEELSHLVPTVSFSARDANANDLPDTSVYVDDVLFATRLDDGKSYELDPGKYTIRYTHAGKETSIRVVLNQGEKGRVLVATFLAAAPSSPPSSAPAQSIASPPRRPVLPLVVSGVGAAAAVTGGIMLGVGLSSVPASCSTATHDCAGPANDPSLSQAHGAMQLANVGGAVLATGAVMLAGGLIWYLVSPSSDTRRGQVTVPWGTF